MRTLGKLISVVCVMTLLVTGSAATELHLHVCIGDEGEWDVGVVECTDDPLSKSLDSESADEHRHGACTDLVVFCGGTGETCGMNPPAPARSASRIHGPGLCQLPPYTIAPSLGMQATTIVSPENSVSYPASLQTVILRI